MSRLAGPPLERAVPDPITRPVPIAQAMENMKTWRGFNSRCKSCCSVSWWKTSPFELAGVNGTGASASPAAKVCILWDLALFDQKKGGER